MNESPRLVASSVMPKAMAVLLISILVANAIQHWLVLPFEGLRSPHEVLGHIVGLFLFLIASLLTAVQPARSLLPAVSGLFLALIIGDVALDAVSPQKFDTVVSLLWLVPGLLMTWSPSTSKCAYARAFFFAGACLQVPHAYVDILYGTTGLNSEPGIYQWVDSNGDLLTRSVYLLALMKMMLSVRPASAPQFSILGDRAGARTIYGIGARSNLAHPVQTPYQQFRSLVSAYKFTWPARMVGIVSSSVELVYWKARHSDSTFADYYAGRISRHLDRGGGHPTLGRRQLFPSRPLEPSALISMDDQRQRGREDFDFVLGLGLKPEHICVDFGCGSLRIGQHLIEYLDAGHYWGLDVTDRFYRDGLALLPPGQVEAKQPNLDVICDECLRLIAQVSPDFIISFSVLSHVPPSEAELYFDRVLRLMRDQTKLIFSFKESTMNFRASGTSWARDAETVEILIRARRPQSDILFHRRVREKFGYPQWNTVVEVC